MEIIFCLSVPLIFFLCLIWCQSTALLGQPGIAQSKSLAEQAKFRVFGILLPCITGNKFSKVLFASCGYHFGSELLGIKRVTSNNLPLLFTYFTVMSLPYLLKVHHALFLLRLCAIVKAQLFFKTKYNLLRTCFWVDPE